MRKFYSNLICLFLLLSLAACAEPPAEWADNPPSGAKIVEAPQIKQGDTWVFKQFRRGAPVPEINYEVKALDVYSDGSYLVLHTDLDKHESKKLILDRSGVPIGIIHPENGKRYRLRNVARTLDLPLWIGKRWKTDVKNQSYDGGPTWRFMMEYAVVAFEKVETQLGTYDAVRIERYSIAAGAQGSDTSEVWYVPELKILAKARFGDYAGRDLIKFTPGE